MIDCCLQPVLRKWIRPFSCRGQDRRTPLSTFQSPWSIDSAQMDWNCDWNSWVTFCCPLFCLLVSIDGRNIQRNRQTEDVDTQPRSAARDFRSVARVRISWCSSRSSTPTFDLNNQSHYHNRNASIIPPTISDLRPLNSFCDLFKPFWNRFRFWLI